MLGERLDDPYSMKNMTKALEKLYPTRSQREDLMPTDTYVRFLPEDGDQYDMLQSLGYSLIDHPLDYRIIRDGDYYHDPAIPEDRLTWQYAVVPHGSVLPEGIYHEVLDECFIPTPGTRTDGVDWDAVEAEAFRLSGNSELFRPRTRAGKRAPAGRITIVDDDMNGGQPFGLAGVTVVCNSFVKVAKAVTDRDGYYEMGKGFSSDVRYRLMFRNSRDFSIGLNLLLVPASMSALGKGSPDGIDYTVTSSSDRKLFVRSAVNNAAYDYCSRCGPDDLAIALPPSGLRIWIFRSLEVSASPMLRHGALVEGSILGDYLGKYLPLLEIFLPDVLLGMKGGESYSEIYSSTCHELAHASHYSRVGNDYWNKYAGYVLKSFARNMKPDYGDGTGAHAGYCEISEMWAYFLQDRLWHDRYHGVNQISGLGWWFRPQIFKYLNDRFFSPSMLFRAMQSDVKDIHDLRDRLLSLYPSETVVINQAFSRYADTFSD